MTKPLETSRLMILSAVDAMLHVCDGASSEDGQGFNGWDSKFVRDVRAKDPMTWTPKMIEALRKTLKKYKGQLTNLGHDWDAIPSVTVDVITPSGGTTRFSPPVDRKVRLDRVGEKVAVTFPYVPDLVAAIRNVAGREWDATRKRWLVPVTTTGLESLQAFLEVAAKHLPVEESAGLGNELASLKQEAEAMQAASIAADSDFHVEGLGGELRPFQRAGVAYASKARRTFIADEMGLGKTVQALATAQKLDAFPMLVVCPASLKINWLRESNKWLPGRHSQVLPSWFKADVDVTNYESLGKLKRSIVQRGYKAIVFDECHYLKNHKAIRTKHAQEIADGIDVRLALSGTPLVNRPAELLAQLGVIGRLEDLGGFKRFAQRYLRWDFKGFGTNLDELQREMRAKCFIRRMKKDVLTELPPKIRTRVEIELASRSAYDHAADDATEEIAAIQLLRHEAARQKLPTVIEWTREFLESGEKLVLFAVHVDIQDALVEAFPGCAKIQGDDPVPTRQAAVDRFQTDKDCRLIVCSLKAAGVGLTLTAASNVAFVEQGWTPGDMEQAEDRCHRIGQTDSVTAWYLVARNTIDQVMTDLIEQKRQAIAAATDAEKSNIDPSIMAGLRKYLHGKFKGNEVAAE